MNKDAKKNISVVIKDDMVALPKATMSEDNLKSIETRIDAVFSTARRSTVDLAECIGTIEKYKGFALLGYASIQEYCAEKYDIKATQAKLMVRLFDRYSIDGEIPSDLKEFGAEKLDVIQRFPTMPKAGNVVDVARELITSLGLKPTDNVLTFKNALKTAKGIAIEDKSDDKSEGKGEDKSEDKSEDKTELSRKTVQLDDLEELLKSLLTLQMNEELSDSDYRKQSLPIINKALNSYRVK